MVIALSRVGKRTFAPASSALSESLLKRQPYRDKITKQTGRRTCGNHKLSHIIEDVLQIGLSISVFCAFFKYTCWWFCSIALILLASQILDSKFWIPHLWFRFNSESAKVRLWPYLAVTSPHFHTSKIYVTYTKTKLLNSRLSQNFHQAFSVKFIKVTLSHSNFVT